MRATRYRFAGTDRFEVRRRLGAGGMGEVYEAFDRERDVVVALKTLFDVSAASVYKFKREFRALADIEHPNLISLGELIEAGGAWFFTMDYVDGADFLRYVAQGSGGTAPYHEARLRNAASQLAKGIIALHQHGKLHRDIKPSNVLVTPAGRLVLLDFGLVVDTTNQHSMSTQKAAVGTVAYMAPEQAMSGAVEAAADWYSFGVMLYEALTGQLPYTGRNSLELLMKKQQYEPAPPRARNASVPPDLDGLCVDLLMRDPSQRPSGAEVLERLGLDAGVPSVVTTQSDLGMTAASVFVGREHELQQLSRAFARVRAGQAGVVHVEGESGLGKSVLVEHFVDEIRSDMTNVVVLSGRCHERESVPYKALDGVIDALARYLRALPDVEVAALMPRNAALLPRVFPVLGRVERIAQVPRRTADAADPHVLRKRAFGALRELLLRCSFKRRLILWIDDLQWTDADSLVALRELVQSDDAPAALLIVSSRLVDESELPELSAFLRELDPQHLRLERLSPGTAETLASTLLRRGGGTGDAAAHIAREAEGHPLYISELVHHAMRSGSSGEARPRLEDAIAARVAELPRWSRELLELVAVAGVPLSPALVGAAAKVDGEGLRKGISLLRLGHLVRTEGGSDDGTVEIYHDRVRQTVFASLDEERTRYCHERIAVSLRTSQWGAARPEMVLEHLSGAGQRASAAQYAEAAAVRASGAFSFELAARLYATALALGEHTKERRRELLVAQAEVTGHAGRRAESGQLLLEAAAEASSVDALELRRLAAEAFLLSGHLDRGTELLHRVLGEVGIAPPRSKRGAMLTVVWGRLRASVFGLRFTAREEAQIAQEELRRVDACWSAATGFAMADTVQGMAFQAMHLRRALRAGEPVRVAMSLALEAGLLACNGRRGIPKAIATVRRCIALADDCGDQQAKAWAYYGWGLSLYQVGEFAAALDKWAQALELAQLPGLDFERGTLLMGTAWCQYMLGDWKSLATDVPNILEEARTRGDLYRATTFACGLPNTAWLIRDEPERAGTLVRFHMARWSRQGYHLQHYWEWFALVQVALYRADVDEAWAVCRGGWSDLRRSLILRISMVNVEAQDLRGRCALAVLARTDPTDSRRRELTRVVRKCVRALKRTGLDVGRLFALVLSAGLSLVQQQSERARAYLEDAIQLGEDMNLAAHVAAARWRLSELSAGQRASALHDQAFAWMVAQDVEAPARMVRVLMPWAGD